MKFPRIFNWRRSRDPTVAQPTEHTALQMVNIWGDNFLAWNGKLYESDLVMSCIRPKVKSIGKLMAKHIRDDGSTGLKVNPMNNIKILLRYPNERMTMQQFLEKMAFQLTLNGNAFALIIRDPETGMKPVKLEPIDCTAVEKLQNEQGTVFLKFTMKNGKTLSF